jgi:hypothetical protein
MPVIGRLDGQVDEVIIKPISERRRGEETPPPPAGGHEPPPADPPGSAPVQTHDTDESSPDTGELPVWLL